MKQSIIEKKIILQTHWNYIGLHGIDYKSYRINRSKGEVRTMDSFSMSGLVLAQNNEFLPSYGRATVITQYVRVKKDEK